VRSGPPFADHFVNHVVLPLGQVARVLEMLDTLGSVRRDNAQLVPAGRHLLRLAAEIVPAALEPPKHFSLLVPGPGSKPDDRLRWRRFLIGPAALGLAGFYVLRLAFDRQQELMKLPADAPLRPAVIQILERTLETSERPMQRNFGILVHMSVVFPESGTTKFHALLLLHAMAHDGTPLMCADGTRRTVLSLASLASSLVLGP